MVIFRENLQLKMSGFPPDFPMSAKTGETAIFVRSDCEVDCTIDFQPFKKVRLAAIESEASLFQDHEMEFTSITCSIDKKHVQFSPDPPVEYPVFTKTEYNRKSTPVSPICNGQKDYYTLWTRSQEQ